LADTFLRALLIAFGFVKYRPFSHLTPSHHILLHPKKLTSPTTSKHSPPTDTYSITSQPPTPAGPLKAKVDQTLHLPEIITTVSNQILNARPFDSKTTARVHHHPP